MIVVLSISLALVVLVLVLWMLLTRRLREKYAVLWLIIALAVLIVVCSPGCWTHSPERSGCSCRQTCSSVRPSCCCSESPFISPGN